MDQCESKSLRLLPFLLQWAVTFWRYSLSMDRSIALCRKLAVPDRNTRLHRGAFFSFFSGELITALVVNPPERKLAKRTSVDWAETVGLDFGLNPSEYFHRKDFDLFHPYSTYY